MYQVCSPWYHSWFTKLVSLKIRALKSYRVYLFISIGLNKEFYICKKEKYNSWFLCTNLLIIFAYLRERFFFFISRASTFEGQWRLHCEILNNLSYCSYFKVCWLGRSLIPSSILISLYCVTWHIHRFGELGCWYIWGSLFCLPKVCREGLWVLNIFAPTKTPLRAAFMLESHTRWLTLPLSCTALWGQCKSAFLPAWCLSQPSGLCCSLGSSSACSCFLLCLSQVLPPRNLSYF